MRLVRPVHELRAPRGGVPPARAEAPGVGSERASDRGQLEQRLLILVTLGLVAFGLVMVFSATSASATLGEGDPMRYLVKQGLYAVAGLVLLVLVSRIDYHRAAPARPGAADRLVRRLRGRARRGARDQRRAPVVPPRPRQRPARRAREGRGLRLDLRGPRAAARAADDGRADEARSVSSSCVFGALIVIEPDLGTTISFFLMVAGVLVVSGLPLGLLVTAGCARSRSAPASRSRSSRTAAPASSASSIRGRTRRAPATRRCRR